MRALVQRVSEASVAVDDQIVGEIKAGILVFLGIEESDNEGDIDWLSNKIINLRIFADENTVMNHSVIDIEGEILLISQFTLHAKVKKGNRPSYIKAAHPDIAVPLYEKFGQRLEELLSKKIERGIFGADMKVKLLNDGPVTIWIDTKNKE
ncbi:MAG: D-aminoacyl-tRNA deacylase [Bacteroidota bacterium]